MGLWEFLILAKVQVLDLDFWLAFEVGRGNLVGLSPSPVGSDAISQLIVLELSCIRGYPEGVRELLSSVGNSHTHTQVEIGSRSHKSFNRMPGKK